MKAWMRGLAAGLCVSTLPAMAQDIAIYRCTDAQGALTVQNQPCPKGMQQQVRRMQAPQAPALPAAPLPARPSPIPAGVASPASPAIAPAVIAPAEVAEKPAPPPLHDCRRRDQTHYLTESLHDTQYCLPMQVVGLDGNPEKGAGEACEVIRDTCEPVTDAGLCEAWQRQLREAEDHWRFATPDHVAERQRELARVREIVAGSRCGDGTGPAQNP